MGGTADRIPVTILSGFLGSGKTTLLNALLRDERLTDTAVIVNEFGEVGLDHLLVESAFDQMVLMDNGCLCCSVRGDLVDTLQDLHARAGAGEIPRFSRVMVETTGLADPGPIAQTLATDAWVAAHFALHAIVVTVDGVAGAASLEAHDEARAQAAIADLLIVTKGDMAGADPGGLRGALRALNPHAPIAAAENGAIDPGVILGLDPTEVPAGAGHDHADAHDPHPHHHAHSDGGIQTATLRFEAPVAWETLSGWLEWMTALRGPDILRIKGLVAVAGCAGPVLIHGVQHVFYPPRVLPDWPDADRTGRLVVIARGVPAGAIAASFDAYGAARRAAA